MYVPPMVVFNEGLSLLRTETTAPDPFSAALEWTMCGGAWMGDRTNPGEAGLDGNQIVESAQQVRATPLPPLFAPAHAALCPR